MIEADWHDCLENSTRKITPDLKRAESLLEVSKQPINQIKKN
jgi:hypothetical protein